MRHRARLAPEHALLAYGVFVAGYLLAISWSQPILDSHHGFRQTQTAISAYWIARDRSPLAYQTPVLGYPWSIPFEFPIYQWLIAEIAGHRAQVDAIDHVGRVLNLIFFMASAALVYAVIMISAGRKRLALICAGTLLISPLMLFWSRAVMIESTAVFFSLAFVASMAEYVRRPRLAWIFVAFATACTAALVKITTFFGFAVFVCGALLVHFMRDTKIEKLKQNVKLAAISGLIVVASLVVLTVWLRHADRLKSQTVWGATLTSSHLDSFTFGTASQRIDTAFWKEVVFGRALEDGLGSPWVMLVAVMVVLTDSRSYKAGLLLIVAYLAPFLAFTNLHLLHDYYQYANVIFVTSLVGLAMWIVSEKWRFGRYLGWVVAVALCVISWTWMSTHYLPLIREDVSVEREMQLAKFIKDHTNRGSTLLIFGLDWSPTLPYYAERKALMIPWWLPAEHYGPALEPTRAFGHSPVGALVLCPNPAETDPAKVRIYHSLISKYSRGLKKSIVTGCEVYS